ncbi:hypothetical protein [Arthrobacter antibioticus]|uniref:hypothetical protein n=1 Tax=Arthrobacter sp. H35-MC1 TaxID=3046203 RepID=UPI0024BA3A6A|nr:hypothetical protein [Arthrobacter sp. H35-MC1]MDJ0316250.1 hypothetical protein [Arthrobacter sp. H35-MC1]
MAELKEAVQKILGSPNNHSLAAVGNTRKAGVNNTPLLTGAPEIVRVIIACNGGSSSTLQVGPDTLSVACDSVAHVIDSVPSKSLTISVPPTPTSAGSIYVAVDKQ